MSLSRPLVSRSLQGLWCQIYTSCTVSTQAQEDFASAKPMSEMPHPLFLPGIGSSWRIPYGIIKSKLSTQNTNLEEISRDFEKYGPIFRNKIGIMEYIQTCDADVLEAVHRVDGKYPQRMIIEGWAKWREERGLQKGIFIETNGEHWRQMRRELDKLMLRPRNVATYVDDFNDVSTDFLARLRKIMKDDLTVENMDKELFNWSLESIGTVIYEKRFGNFNEVRDPESDEFIQAVTDMFRSTGMVAYFPPKIGKLLFPKWYELHWNAWDVIFKRGKLMIDVKMEEIQEKLANGDDVSGFLSGILASKSMSLGEIYANISELMAAAVDTTSNAMQWAIERLAWHPDIQQKLYEEIRSVVPSASLPNYQNIQDMPYLRAIVKETLRMYPIAGFVTKVIQEDVVLRGYAVPKGTTLIGCTIKMARDPNLYSEPDSFKPERWLRGDVAREKMHAFAYLPFGHGPRMCIGRRVAEMEMHILLTQLISSFEISPVDTNIKEPGNTTLIVPSEPVNVYYKERKA